MDINFNKMYNKIMYYLFIKEDFLLKTTEKIYMTELSELKWVKNALLFHIKRATKKSQTVCTLC